MNKPSPELLSDQQSATELRAWYQLRAGSGSAAFVTLEQALCAYGAK